MRDLILGRPAHDLDFAVDEGALALGRRMADAFGWGYFPLDAERGTVANVRGRVVENGAPVPGLYVTGWIKRGPSGFIGTNKTDSRETVDNLLADVAARR